MIYLGILLEINVPAKALSFLPPSVRWLTMKPTSQRCCEYHRGGWWEVPMWEPTKDSYCGFGGQALPFSEYLGNQLPFDQALVSSFAHIPGRILGTVWSQRTELDKASHGGTCKLSYWSSQGSFKLVSRKRRYHINHILTRNFGTVELPTMCTVG